MPTILLTVFIISILILGCVWLYERQRKNDPVDLDSITKKKVKDQILKTVYDCAGKDEDRTGSETLKITLLERLNISPALMKECLKDLFSKKMIMETDDSVSLTTFGVEHYEVFIKGKKK